MDPADQSAFHPEITTTYKPGEKSCIIIRYRDGYNTLCTQTYELSIIKIAEEARPPRTAP